MTEAIVYRMPCADPEDCRPERLQRLEWLVTNGLGGYASGTLAGTCTRRYHGLLVAALPAPLGRMMMFNHLVEQIRLPDGRIVPLAGDIQAGAARNEVGALESFSLENGLPVWRYKVDGFVLERRVVLPYRANTVHLIYRLLAATASIRLRVRPGLHFRPHEAPVAAPLVKPYPVIATGDHFEICGSRSAAHTHVLARAGRCDGARWRSVLRSRICPGARARLRASRRALVAGLFSCRPGPGAGGDAVCVDRIVGRRDWPSNQAMLWPQRSSGGELIDQAEAHPALGAAQPPSWYWPPISSSLRPRPARPTRRGRTPRATKFAR